MQQNDQSWCVDKGSDPTLYSSSWVLIFLQLLADRNLTLFMVKTYAAAISSCPEGHREQAVSAYPLVEHFYKMNQIT